LPKLVATRDVPIFHERGEYAGVMGQMNLNLMAYLAATRDALVEQEREECVGVMGQRNFNLMAYLAATRDVLVEQEREEYVGVMGQRNFNLEISAPMRDAPILLLEEDSAKGTTWQTFAPMRDA